MDRVIVEGLVRAAKDALDIIDGPKAWWKDAEALSLAIAAAERELSKDQPGSKIGRPEGWTDQRAMEFVGAKYSEHDALSVERIAFMRHFLKGEWAVVNKYFPEFQLWLDKKGGK